MMEDLCIHKKNRRRLPDWIKAPLPAEGSSISDTNMLLKELGLSTVCHSAVCPNRMECFNNRTATFLILGEVCTRNCSFCAIKGGAPAPADLAEPARVAEAAARLRLSHVVVTSVTRDDLDDGGAGQFAATIGAIRERLNPHPPAVEVLIPDLRGSFGALETVLAARPTVLGHNVETVPRLYGGVRPGADFGRSLSLLKYVKSFSADTYTKSGLMLGLGETKGEVLRVLEGLRGSGCDIVTLGQYLAPSVRHAKVHRYVHPDEFDELRDEALAMGFRGVLSGPMVRSSYHAGEVL